MLYHHQNIKQSSKYFISKYEYEYQIQLCFKIRKFRYNVTLVTKYDYECQIFVLVLKEHTAKVTFK